MGKILFPLGLGTALSLLGDATLYTVLPTHTAEAGITLAGVGILLGINRAVRLFLNGPAGLAYDRWARRRLFVPALFVGALSTAIYAATRGFWPLFFGRMLWGLAWSGIWVGGATIILDAAAPRERGRWTGLYQIWFFVGGALGALGGGVLTDVLGYANTMWICSGLTAAGGVVALFRLPETLRSRSDTRREEDQPTTDAGARLSGRIKLHPKHHGSLWLAVSLQGVNRFILSGVAAATLGLLVQEWMQSSSIALGVATVTGMLMAVRTVLAMAAAPLVGVWSDRKGSRWTFVAWGLAMGAIGMALLAWDAPVAIAAGIAATSVSGGSVQSLTTTLTGDLVSPAQRGRAIGMLHTAGDFGSAIGPSIAYILLPWIGLRAVYLLCAALFLLTLMVVLSHSGKQQVTCLKPKLDRPGRRSKP
jgi:MFS family permease